MESSGVHSAVRELQSLVRNGEATLEEEEEHVSVTESQKWREEAAARAARRRTGRGRVFISSRRTGLGGAERASSLTVIHSAPSTPMRQHSAAGGVMRDYFYDRCLN